MMGILASGAWVRFCHRRARLDRAIRRVPAAVHYFHQVDDPYSHLAVQKLASLEARYRIPFIPHLVGPPGDAWRGDVDRFQSWTVRDARAIAPYYGLTLPDRCDQPDPEAVARAIAALAHTSGCQAFAERAIECGERLWSGAGGDDSAHGAAAPTTTQPEAKVLAAGERLRARLGHYLGAMFWYDGEWYWGVDRLHLLEARLQQEGLGGPPAAFVASPPRMEPHRLDARRLTLEYFPSLRSPYTAIGHARVCDLVERTGVQLRLRPVMPMMMRGVPAPRAKQRYIITDAAREARWQGIPFGRFVDPFGEPVRRAFALYPVAAERGRGMAFVGAYLAAAFAHGVDITTDTGLATVAADAGLDYAELQRAASGRNPAAELEANVAEMLDAGLWGVPSFRLTGGDAPAFSSWGQDRIWRVEAEMRARLEPDRVAARLS
jgi:2-hydroxychromene-2-carboxylate isomerase